MTAMFVLPALVSLAWAEPTVETLPPQPIEVADEQADEEADELAQIRTELRALRAEREALAHERQQLESQLAATERVSMGEEVHVEEGQTVDDVVAFGNDVIIHGHVLGSATSFGGDVLVEPPGIVDGDVLSVGGTIIVEEGAVVHGDRVDMDVPSAEGVPAGPVGLGSISPAAGIESIFTTLYRRIVVLLSLAGAGVLVVGLFPNHIGRIASALEDRPIQSAFVGSFATGFVSLFAVLFALVTLFLGSPVSVVLLGLLGLAWLLGFVGLCQAIGDKLPFERKPHGRWVAFVVGVTLLTCLGSLPAVGWFVVFGASVIGIGAAISTRLGTRD